MQRRTRVTLAIVAATGALALGAGTAAAAGPLDIANDIIGGGTSESQPTESATDYDDVAGSTTESGGDATGTDGEDGESGSDGGADGADGQGTTTYNTVPGASGAAADSEGTSESSDSGSDSSESDSSGSDNE